VTDDQVDESTETSEAAIDTASQEQPQYGVGPFSVREVVLVGVWLVAFIVSFFSVASEQAMAQLLFGGSVWTNGLDWVLTIGVPTIAVFLIVLRRFSPDGIRRVGSLGIDQFASVAFSVSAVVWLTLLWRNVVVAIESSIWIYGWVVWVEFFLMLAGVVLTVAARFIPALAEDFVGRREVPAHRSARPIRAVLPRPAREPKPNVEEPAAADPFAPGAVAQGGYAESPYAASPYGDSASTAQLYTEPQYGEPASGDQGAWAPTHSRDTFEPIDNAEDVDSGDTLARTEPEPQVTQAFWALAPDERDVVDDRGVPIYRIGPTAWTLVLEDRGELFVVRHEDGRVGYLHDVSGVTRG